MFAAETYGKIIISELGLPGKKILLELSLSEKRLFFPSQKVERKIVKPVAVGGQGKSI